MRYTPRRGRILAACLIAGGTSALVAASRTHHPVLADVTIAVAVADYVLAAVHLRLAHLVRRGRRGAKP